MSLPALFKKTLKTVTRPAMIGIMLLCAALAFLVVLCLVGGITWMTAGLVTLERQWLDTAVNWVVGIVTGIGGWFMLPVLMILIAGVFQEMTIHRVEKAEYPDQVRTGEPNLWTDILHDIRFTLKAIGLNLLVLPFYLVGVGFFLSIALNSYLLGREFFESAAGYHLGKPGARELGRKHWQKIYGSGFVITMLTLVPILNLFAPIIAIVWMVHLYHGLPEESQPITG